MSKKKTIVLLSIFLIFSISAIFMGSVKAHSPYHLDLKYIPAETKLSVGFVHGVTDKGYHFVENVEILINGSTMVDQDYSAQPTTNVWFQEYTLAAVTGDNITVIATCSLGGKEEKTLILGATFPFVKGSFATTAAPTAVSTIIVAVIAFLPKLSQKMKKRK
ncbi:MAG: hypothetical protein ACXADU_09260 [Promethearchaeota archaeon]|jgi:hypothetical protein